MNAINYTKDILDVRELVERYEELSEERKELVEALEEDEEEGLDNSYGAKDVLQSWDDDNKEEFDQLHELLNELSGYDGDVKWEGNYLPSILIAENHFEEYMDERIPELYELPKNLPSFISLKIDYDALAQDYGSVEVMGESYYCENF